MSKVKEFHTGRNYIIVGWNWRRFGVGINIDRYSFTLDLIWLWIAVEW